MDSNTNQIHGYNQQTNSGLLRFRSAPSSLLANSCESERLFSRFVDYRNDDSECLSDDNKSVVMSMSGGQRSCSSSGLGLPPHYPRQSSNSVENQNGSSFGLVVNSHSSLIRQSSSPAGLFSQISVPNGNSRFVLFFILHHFPLFIYLFFIHVYFSVGILFNKMIV